MSPKCKKILLDDFLTELGFTALALNDYQPVSGNWCWLSVESQVLRYALAHGWRISIITIILSLYACLFIHIHRHFSSLRKIARLNERSNSYLNRIRPDANASRSAARTKIVIYNEFEMYTEPLDSYWNPAPYQDNCFTLPDAAEKRNVEDGPLMPPLSPIGEIRHTIHPHHSEESNKFTSRHRHAPSNHTSFPLLTRDPLALIRRPPTNISYCQCGIW